MAENSNDAHVNLWDAKTKTLAKRLPGHTLHSNRLAFSKDGQWLAASEHTPVPDALGIIRGVQIWNLDGFAPVWTDGLRIDIRLVAGIHFSGNGDSIYLFGSDDQDRAAIWKCHRDSAEVTWKWTSAQGLVHAIADSRSNDGLWLCQTVHEDGQHKTSVLGLTVPSGETKVILREFTEEIAFAKFSSDGSHLVTGKHNPVRKDAIVELDVFEMNQGQRVHQIIEPDGSLEAFCFSRYTNSLYVVCANSLKPNSHRILRKWDADLQRLAWVRTLAPGLKVTAMTMHPSSETLVLRRNEDSRIHYLELDRPTMREFEGQYPKEAWSVTFSQDSQRLLSGGDDGLARVWDVPSGQMLDQFEDHLPQLVTTAAFVPNAIDRVATGSFDNTVKIWSLLTPDRAVSSLPHGALVRKLAFSPDGQSLLTIADDFFVRSWDSATGQLRWKTAAGKRKLKCLAVHPNGSEVAVAGNDGILRMFSTVKGTHKADAASSSSEIWSLVYSPLEATWLVGTNAGAIERFERRVSQLTPWGMSGTGIRALALSPDGRTLASANNDGEIELWQVASTSRIGVLDRVDQATHSLAFSPDGQYLAAALHDGSIRVWNAPDPRVGPITPWDRGSGNRR
jgi:WD40 repeat protein